MTAADGRATDAALGRSGTPTPATPRHAAAQRQPSRMSEPPAGRSGSVGAVVGGADAPAARRPASADARAGGSEPSGGSTGRVLSASAPLGGVASTDNGAGETADAGTPAHSGSPVASGPQAPSGTPATTPPGTPPPVDTMAAVVRQWQAVHPGIDTRPMEIIGRINRSAALLQQAEDAPLRRAGLTRPEFDVLGTLRRTGHELTPSEIARETFSSGAAVTKRLKQLTERGLVERRGDTRDRRVAHVRLTDAGRDLVDGILPQQLAYETTALSGIDLARQRELAGLLGELLGQLEGRLGVPRV